MKSDITHHHLLRKLFRRKIQKEKNVGLKQLNNFNLQYGCISDSILRLNKCAPPPFVSVTLHFQCQYGSVRGVPRCVRVSPRCELGNNDFY